MNGGAPLTLVNPYLTGVNPYMLYALPPGASVVPSDAVAISAPAAWANTGVGIAAAMSHLAVANCTGRSSYGTDTLAKTLCPGVNNAHLGSQYGGVYSIPKNWRFRCDNFAGMATQDATGRPLTGSATPIGSFFYSMGPQASVDKTLAAPLGLWAVGWDDLLPSDPTTLGLETWSPLILSVTERLDLYNPGAGGIGKVRVFQVAQVATTPQDGNYNAVASLRLTVANANKTFRYANDVVYGPGDFATTPGVPTVLDRSDPYALSNAYLAWLKNGVGTVRWIDSLFGYGGQAPTSEPEHVWRLSDYSWGNWSGRPGTINGAYFTTARPWDPGVTPYLYSTTFGTPYSCTLAAPLDAVATVLSISDAATAPVMYGLRLVAGSELMRVLSVSGTSVTVEQGACGTTPASHASGTIQVQNRWDASGPAIPTGGMVELVSSTPHGINAGQTLTAYGSWPTFTFSDGSHPSGGSITNYSYPVFPTGPNTVLMYVPIGNTPWVTLGSAVCAGPVLPVAGLGPATPAIPIELAAKVAAHFPGCALHFSLPHAASDSLAWAGWQWVRDNYPADRPAYFEFSNEPWNYYFTEFTMLAVLSHWLYGPADNGWEFYVKRMTDIVTIGRQVWAAAAATRP